MKRFGAALRYLAYLGLTTLLVILLAEGSLRLFLGLPRGLFHFRPLDNTGLYRPNATLHMSMGPIPYRVETNALGFRGPDIAAQKPAGVTRIIALGDSITDGFFVDNPDTYPCRLQAYLRAHGVNAEVVNAARGGASIDREYEILRKFCMPLEPDWVVLTFVTNDLDDIAGLNREQLVSRKALEFSPEAASEWFLFGRTALGELVLDLSLSHRYAQYGRNRAVPASGEEDHRYEIAGARDYQNNVRLFIEKHAKQANRFLLEQTFGGAEQALIEDYLYALGHMRRHCEKKGVRLVFAYAPGYNQVHDPDSPMILQEALNEGCTRLGIPFLDLTPVFQRAAQTEVLFLAPVDFHYTPAGYRVTAEAIGGFLLTQRITRGERNP